jgi:hypothetical protein
MKQAGYSKRPRGRSPESSRQPQKYTNGDAREVKSRGNPQQCVDKYLTLAREASSSGDPVSAENYYQYADHYYRLAAENRTPLPPRPEKRVEVRENKPASSDVTSTVAAVFS